MHKSALALMALPLLLAAPAPAQDRDRRDYNPPPRHGDYYNGMRDAGHGGQYEYHNEYRRPGGIGPGKGAAIGAVGGAVLGTAFGGGLKGAMVGGAAGAGIGAIAGQAHQNHERREYPPR